MRGSGFAGGAAVTGAATDVSNVTQKAKPELSRPQQSRAKAGGILRIEAMVEFDLPKWITLRSPSLRLAQVIDIFRQNRPVDLFVNSRIV
jgi:hypothetical protein